MSIKRDEEIHVGLSADQEQIVRAFEQELLDLVNRYREDLEESDIDDLNEHRQALRHKLVSQIFSSIQSSRGSQLEVPLTTLLHSVFQDQEAAALASESMKDRIKRINERLMLPPKHSIRFDLETFERYVDMLSKLYLLKSLLALFEMDAYEQQIIEAEIRRRYPNVTTVHNKK